jgi:hypothetical protein
METSNAAARWWAEGLLFENCSCQLVCPGHMHFSQLCTHERCLGYWAIRVDEGEFGDVLLAGVKAVIAFDAPQHMISGNWTEVVIIDEAASREQREAMAIILTGHAGGPWEVLAKFVGRRLETRYLPIAFREEDGRKTARIPGLLETAIQQIRGRDRAKPVLFENIFNQIHAATQVLATGSTDYDDGVIRIKTMNTHGLSSHFEWRVESS